MEKILNIRIDNVTLAEILEKVKEAVDSRKKLHIITLNTEMIIKAQTDNDFLSIIQNAGLVVPESSGISLANNYQADSSPVKIIKLIKSGIKTFLRRSNDFSTTPGADLVVSLAGMAQEFGYKLTLVGGQEGVALEAANKLRDQFPKLKVSGFSGGKVGLDDEKIFREVKEANGDIILVAFGQGKQEKWISENLAKIDASVAVGVGGSLDFLAGKVSRAPKWMRGMGLEWAYRLIRQPWRAKRQLSLLKFLALLLKS